jgi:adenylylsulfate kinase
MMPIWSTVNWINADEVRKKFNDWDFSKEGRIRQSLRMAQLAFESLNDYVICDFVAPLVEMRNNFKADWTIWVDTIDKGRFEDTNKAFIPPEVYDFRVTEQNAEKLAAFIGEHIINKRRRPVFNWQKETDDDVCFRIWRREAGKMIKFLKKVLAKRTSAELKK